MSKRIALNRQWIVVTQNSLTDIDGKQRLFSSHANFFKTKAAAMKYADQFWLWFCG